MHGVAVRVTIKDWDAATQFLRDEVLPRVTQAPGFVGGYWFRLPDGEQGRSIAAFETEEQARQVADQMQGPSDDVATLDSVDVVEITAHA